MGKQNKRILQSRGKLRKNTIINVYKDALTNAHTEYKNAENKTFYEVFPDKDFTSAIIIVNGEKVEPDYRLKRVI